MSYSYDAIRYAILLWSNMVPYVAMMQSGTWYSYHTLRYGILLWCKTIRYSAMMQYMLHSYHAYVTLPVKHNAVIPLFLYVFIPIFRTLFTLPVGSTTTSSPPTMRRWRTEIWSSSKRRWTRSLSRSCRSSGRRSLGSISLLSTKSH